MAPTTEMAEMALVADMSGVCSRVRNTVNDVVADEGRQHEHHHGPENESDVHGYAATALGSWALSSTPMACKTFLASPKTMVVWLCSKSCVLHARAARPQAALDDEDGARPGHINKGHAKHRARGIVLCGGVHDVVGTHHQGDIGIGKLGVGGLPIQELRRGHLGLVEQDVHVAGN